MMADSSTSVGPPRCWPEPSSVVECQVARSAGESRCIPRSQPNPEFLRSAHSTLDQIEQRRPKPKRAIVSLTLLVRPPIGTSCDRTGLRCRPRGRDAVAVRKGEMTIAYLHHTTAVEFMSALRAKDFERAACAATVIARPDPQLGKTVFSLASMLRFHSSWWRQLRPLEGT